LSAKAVGSRSSICQADRDRDEGEPVDVAVPRRVGDRRGQRRAAAVPVVDPEEEADLLEAVEVEGVAGGWP
jgi:hypothetical protein